MRVVLPGAVERVAGMMAKGVVGRIQSRVLASENQRRLEPERVKRVGKRCELDGFGARSDDDE